MEDLRAQWESRYQEGPTPWDTSITPPEVVAFWRSGRLAATGLALDLGGGTATNALYLAERGLHVASIEIASPALARGLARLATQPALRRAQISLIQGSVSALPLGGGCVNYALDIGCFHGLPLPLRHDYAQELKRVMIPGGYYQLYAFAEDADARGARGLADDEVAARFADAFTIVEIETATPNPRPCYWYLLQRQ